MKIMDEKLLDMVEEQCGDAWKVRCEIRINGASLDGSRIPGRVYAPEFSEIRDQVFFRLVNPATDPALLEQMPFVGVYDLVAVFFVLLKKQGMSLIVLPIQKELQKRWKVPAEELWRCAMENTPRIFPASLCGVFEAIFKEFGACDKESTLFSVRQDLETEPFYILSNDTRMHGVAAMLYEGTLQKAAEALNTDLAVIPSSIHEVLLVRLDKNTDIWELKKILHSVNMEEVEAEDRISENIYIYRREKGCLEVAQGMDFLGVL